MDQETLKKANELNNELRQLREDLQKIENRHIGFLYADGRVFGGSDTRWRSLHNKIPDNISGNFKSRMIDYLKERIDRIEKEFMDL